MKTKKTERWRLWADSRLQGGLLIRLALYWGLFQLAHLGTNALFLFLSNGGSSEPGNFVGFVPQSFVVSTLLLPMVMFDMLRFSNRFAGPLLRLRREMRNLVDDEVAEETRFRCNDFYPEISSCLNELREELQAYRDSNRNQSSTAPSQEVRESIVTECHV